MKKDLYFINYVLIILALVTFLSACSTPGELNTDSVKGKEVKYERVVKHGRCGEILENHFSEIQFDLFEISLDGHKNDINQLKYMCVRKPSYADKIMYDKFGVWTSILETDEDRRRLKVWKDVDLLSTGELYVVLTYGCIEKDYVYTSFLVFDSKNQDALREDSEERQELVDFFAQAIKNDDKFAKDYYRVNYAYQQEIFNSEKIQESKRVESGKLDKLSRNKILHFLAEHKKRPDANYPYTVLLYYPGPTLSNTTGMATRKSIGKRVAKVKRKLEKRHSNMIGVCGSMDGIERWNRNLNYVLDQDSVVFKTFFENRDYGNSYTMVDSLGNYISYFGEYMIEQIIDDLEKLKETE